MLTYQFSTREKVLLVTLAVIVIAIAWFMLVYQNTAARISSLDAEIANLESTIEIDAARVGQLNSMKSAIEEHKAAGDTRTEMPEYDNLQPLMAELNRIMGMTETYSISFDAVDTQNGEFVERGARIDFNCGSYRDAESVVYALAEGRFPCSIDTVSIIDKASMRQSGASGASASVHVTFYEKHMV